jgi:hypothetical protein
MLPHSGVLRSSTGNSCAMLGSCCSCCSCYSSVVFFLIQLSNIVWLCNFQHMKKCFRAARAEGHLQMESKNKLLPRDGIHTAATYMLLLPLGYPLIEPIKEMGQPWWNLRKSWATSDGIRTAALYSTHMLLFPLGYSRWIYSLEEMGHLWWNQDLKTRTAVMNGMGICRRNCHSSFYNIIRSFYNIIWCHFCSFCIIIPFIFLWRTLLYK